jgi:hypothetical protein
MISTLVQTRKTHWMLAVLVAGSISTVSASEPASALRLSRDQNRSAEQNANKTEDLSLDPFLAGALGIVPFASGLYLSDRPARGVIFTAIDVLTALGVYTSKYTVAGDPDNVRNYFLLMAANNVLDAYVSTRYALRAGHLQTMVLPMPGGGYAGMVAWRF